MMNTTDIARVTMQAWTQTKLLSCADNGGPRDLIPQVDTMHRTPTGDLTHCVALIQDRDLIPEAVQAACAASEPSNTLAFVAQMSDVYMRQVDRDDLGTTARGDATRRFHAGDLSVQEGIVVLVMDAKTGELVVASRDYTYRDNGMPKFGQVDIINAADEGALVDGGTRDAMEAALRSVQS